MSGPAHAGLFEAGADDVLAAGFDAAGADERAECAVVGKHRGLLAGGFTVARMDISPRVRRKIRYDEARRGAPGLDFADRCAVEHSNPTVTLGLSGGQAWKSLKQVNTPASMPRDTLWSPSWASEFGNSSRDRAIASANRKPLHKQFRRALRRHRLRASLPLQVNESKPRG